MCSFTIDKGVSATNPKLLELLKLHPTVKPVGLLHEVLLDLVLLVFAELHEKIC